MLYSHKSIKIPTTDKINSTRPKKKRNSRTSIDSGISMADPMTVDTIIEKLDRDIDFALSLSPFSTFENTIPSTHTRIEPLMDPVNRTVVLPVSLKEFQCQRYASQMQLHVVPGQMPSNYVGIDSPPAVRSVQAPRRVRDKTTRQQVDNDWVNLNVMSS